MFFVLGLCVLSVRTVWCSCEGYCHLCAVSVWFLCYVTIMLFWCYFSVVFDRCPCGVIACVATARILVVSMARQVYVYPFLMKLYNQTSLSLLNKQRELL